MNKILRAVIDQLRLMRILGSRGLAILCFAILSYLPRLVFADASDAVINCYIWGLNAALLVLLFARHVPLSRVAVAARTLTTLVAGAVVGLSMVGVPTLQPMPSIWLWAFSSAFAFAVSYNVADYCNQLLTPRRKLRTR